MSNLRSETVTPREPDVSAADEKAQTKNAAPLVLGLDTATEVRSVAVARGAEVLACVRGRVQRENSARVLQDIGDALQLAATRLEAVELFAVATGPGSFTGLRSGLATVKAFASTLQRPIVGVPTLHAIAASCQSAARIVASLPAGRGEVFAQLLALDGAGEVIELGEPVHLSPAVLLERAAGWGGDLTWAGEGAHANVEALRRFARERGIAWGEEGGGVAGGAGRAASWRLAPPFESYAERIALLGLNHYRRGSTIVAEDLHALYVRLSDAELNEKCRV